ncbi:SLAIN motif family, member 1b isoform X2 [Sinocyclocheilus rhinocerous]|uniref:SLAIN motif family, member 1b isoform X2 n=1 Tax=Sinocyclocheilus rhinocerous TaxID=307959 RepID=UPI0007B887DF|nr:PREDICTED: SLAIN motif-containing protein 1-like isoform X2 [Sinocyclocheilus rhinocerous]
MEAAVLERRMMADARAELQVQKLQELVRRLERQNEQLRSSRCIPPDPFPYFQPHSAAEDQDDDEDELTLLDLQSASGESDETWLYESPSSHLRSGAGLDALQWTRHVLDQLDTARHSLGQRLESGRRVLVDSDVSASEPDAAAVSHGYKLQDLTDVQVMARLQEESLRQDYASTSSSSSVSLRSSSFSFQFGQHSDSHLDEEEEEDEDYGQLPPPQPRLSQAGPLQRSLPHSHTFSSIRDWTQMQTQTHCRDTQPGLSSSSDQLRRSMPNLLVCAALSPALSSVSMRNSQSFDSSGALTRLQSCIPAPAQLQSRVQSVGSFSSRQPLRATAYVSPTVKGSSLMSSSVSLQSLSVSGVPKTAAASRSGLPRPSSFISTGSGPRAKLTAPLRSLLPPPKSLATLSALRDGSWRDGCY